ncbi:MAG: hypothetical protein GY774_36905 [Planctomycetes bacterium]|nr:hypothetical protein [Planctomycetota bacterium]
METQIKSNSPKKIRAGKFSKAASICLLVGISYFFISLLVGNSVQPHDHSFRDICALGIFLSVAIIFLVAPFLGLLAVRNILSNWRSFTNPDNGSKNEDLIRGMAFRFLVPGLLFAIVSLVPVIFVVTVGHAQFRVFPDLLSIFLIIMTLLSLVMSCISYKLFTKTSISIRLRISAIFVVTVSIFAMVAVFSSTSFGNRLIQRFEYSRITETFSGNSSSLEQTSIVSTLDSPCPKKNNLIWCSSFQLAWNRIKEDVVGEPVEVVGAEELAVRLNSAKQTSDDLESDSFYAAAGRINQGIVGRIKKDMAAKFPAHSVPDFSGFANVPEGILAYSYLIANVPFKYPYRQVRDEFIFTDSNGVKTNVGAFGVWKYGSQHRKIREQAEILFFQGGFAIDLCRHSQPYQVVVAMVKPKESLAQTLSYIRNQIADFKQTDNYEQMRFLDSGADLMVPEMFWEIDHGFDELIGKIAANADPSMPILEAKQGIKFRLDRYGASVESDFMSIFGATARPKEFKFNRPFLVYMKKRDSEQPFFVMWVDNAELLNKK